MNVLLLSSAVLAGVFSFTEPKSAALPVLSPSAKEFLKLSPDELDAKLRSDEGYRKAVAEVVTKPEKVRFAWKYVPDDGESAPQRFRTTLIRRSDGSVVRRGRTDGASVCLDNLEIACDYRFRVAAGEGEKTFSADFDFRTEDAAPRVLRIDGIGNVRDVGGWIGEGGERVRQGLVYRSQGFNDGALWYDRVAGKDGTTKKVAKPKEEWRKGKSRISEESRRECLETLGIRTDLDLRAADTECWGMSGSPLGSSVAWRLVPGGCYGALSNETARAGFAQAFRVFLDEANYPVVIHCSAGADRTGSLVYILNALLGVKERDLELDYHFTATAGSGGWPAKGRDGACYLDGLKAVFAAYPGATENDRVRAYVLSCGFTEDDVARFRAIMFGRLAAGAGVAQTGAPPAPPGPEGWEFRRELAEDPPPEYPAPAGKPWLENRISRCFFSPIKRPPFNRDELKDDLDYYPDNYLERLRREGVNGLWLSLALRDLDDRSLAKLRRVVGKCARHGIKVWAFGIEPKNRPFDDPFFVAHPESRGAKTWDGNHVNCPSSPETLSELEAEVARLFAAVPGLAGMINIANGERATTCLSFADPTKENPSIPCAKCSRREPWELYADVASAMVRGMRRGNPEARLITWFYHPHPAPVRATWVAECAKHVPEGAEFQFNFESGAVREQVGRTRHGGDYWLSFPGPSDPFRLVADASHAAGRPLSAKIQTSCSHECATVPYVPVPGLLYRKFRGMREAGVRDVMMCWYFGNAPGLMNRAAGLLAYEDFASGEDAFLERLAKDEWGEDAAVVGGLWRKFSDAYSHYPLSNDIQYYGPFHAGFSWPLYPNLSMRSLQRTWKPLETPGGDLLGEALSDFTLDEAYECAAAMLKELEGVRPVLDRLRTKYAGDRDRRRDLGIMVTLMDLFESGRDIFDFYRLRRDAVFASRLDGDGAAALVKVAGMRRLLARERELSSEMMPICRDDSRIGFHSEAQAHQFTADYLAWRIGELDRAERELDAIERELKAGHPWPESERERTAATIEAEELPDGSLVFSGECRGSEGLPVELRTYDLCGTAHALVYEVKPEEGRYRVTVPAADWRGDRHLEPAWAVVRQGRDHNNGGTVWAYPDVPMFPEPRLHQDALTGDNFARIRMVRPK